MLTRFALNNPMLVLALVLLALVFGPLSFLSHPSREDPKITIRSASVAASYAGMSAARVEQLITIPIEEKIREIPEVDEITSISSTGRTLVNVTVADEYANMEPIWSDLRDKMEEVQRNLPSGTSKPLVDSDKGDVAMATIALTSDGFTNQEMYTAAKNLRRALYAAVPGIRRVSLIGKLNEQVFVEFDDVRLTQLGISAQQIISAVQGQNIIQSGGRVEVDGQTLTIEPTGDFATIEELLSVPLSIPQSAGRVIYLRDIAKINLGYEDPPGPHAFYNGNPAIVISVSMIDGFDANAFAKGLTAYIDAARDELPIGMFLDYITYQPEEITNAIFSVLNNLWQTIVIVLLVVVAFLGLRTGLIVGAMVPLVMVVTILLMRMVGIDLERMSLASLIIALGLLVDNGIVIAEDLQGRFARGENRRQAALAVGQNLSAPLLAASLTTIFAFVPLMLMPGSAGEYTGSISLVLALALIVSWLIAMSALVLFCVWFLGGGKAAGETNEYGGFAYNAYRRVMRTLVRFKWVTVPLSFATIMIGIVQFEQVSKTFFPASERTQLQIVVELPVGANTYATQEVIKRLSTWLGDADAHPEIANYVGYVATGGPRFYLSLSPIDGFPNNGYFIVNVNDPGDVGPLADKVREFAAAAIPEARITPKRMSLGPGESGLIEYRLYGPDENELKRISLQLQASMRTVAGAIDIKDDWGNPSVTVKVVINQELARRAGVTSQAIADALDTQLAGRAVTDYRIGERVIPVVFRADGNARFNIDRLRTLNIAGTDGAAVPLLQVATFEGDPQYSRIKRQDLKRVMTVSAKHLFLTATAFDQTMAPAVAEMRASLPRGYVIEQGGEVEDSKDANSKLSGNMPLAFAMMVLVLIWQFNSFLKPAMIVSVIPLAITGVSAALLLAPGANFGFMAILGFLALTGIVINNAIILMDYIKIELETAASVADAVVEAGVKRLRPIIMTTCTTVLGLAPIIVSRDVLFYDLALVIAGGLLFATLLTLVVIPCLYTMVYWRNETDRPPNRFSTEER